MHCLSVEKIIWPKNIEKNKLHQEMIEGQGDLIVRLFGPMGDCLL
jgi:hypothetical protein